MRVPIYEVKVNGSAVDVKDLEVSIPPKSTSLRCTLETPSPLLNLGDEVEVSFFSEPLFRGIVTLIERTERGYRYTAEVNAPRVLKTYISNRPVEGCVEAFGKVVSAGNALTLFKTLLSRKGWSLVNIGEAPPLETKGYTVEGDLIEAIAKYYRDFAPIVFADPVEKIVYLIWGPLPQTWNIPEKPVITFRALEKPPCSVFGSSKTVVISNKPVTADMLYGNRESKCGDSCVEGKTFRVVSEGENIKTINTYRIDPESKTIRLVKSEVYKYGLPPRPAIPVTFLSKCRSLSIVPIKEEEVLIEKRIKTYGDDRSYREEIYKWIVSDYTLVPIGDRCPDDTLRERYYREVSFAFVPIYSFELAGETVTRTEESVEPLSPDPQCEYELVRRATITERREYTYFPQEGGMLTIEDVIKFSNLKPGDKKKKTITKRSTSEQLILRKRRTGEVISKIETRDGEVVGSDDYGEETVIGTVTGGGDPVASGKAGREEFVNIVHPDLTNKSLKWAVNRISQMCRTHSKKIEITLPILPVKVGQQFTFLGETWVIEGFRHTVRDGKANTTIYGRLAW